MHILIADDELTARLLLKAALEKSGFRICLAVDGEDALRQFQQRFAVTPAAMLAEVMTLVLSVLPGRLLMQGEDTVGGHGALTSARVVFPFASLATLLTPASHLSGLRLDHQRLLEAELATTQQDVTTDPVFVPGVNRGTGTKPSGSRLTSHRILYNRWSPYPC